MTKFPSFAILLLSILLVSYKSIDDKNPQSWKPLNSVEGVSVYERWVSIDQNLTVREQKGEIFINNNIKTVVDFISHSPNNVLWMSGVKQTLILKKENAHNWITYTLFDIPWPLCNRDLVANNTLTKNKTGSRYQIDIEGLNDIVPEKKNISRFIKYHARWVIEEHTINEVKVTFTVRLDETPDYPRIIQDPIVRRSFFNSFVNLKNILK